VARSPTAPIAAASLIAGYATAVATGSRPIGGLVLLCGGLWCVRAWLRAHDRRTAVTLTAVAFAAFVASHVLALAIGAWPAVLLAAGVTAAVVWRRADAVTPGTHSAH
jgi:hypothetical protein